MAIEKITQAEIDANNVKSSPDAPTGTSTEIKNIFDKLPELIITRLNNLIDGIKSITDGSSGADNIGATPIYENGANTSQGILEELKAKKIETADIISEITTAMRENKIPNEKAIYLIMEAIGAGDMVKSVYDPTNQAKDIFAELSALNTSLSEIAGKGYVVCKDATGDLNNLKANGKYGANGTTVLNCPDNTNSFMIDVTAIETNYITQEASPWWNPDAIRYRRAYNNGTWTPWKEIATTESRELTLLNGWVKSYDYTPKANRSGNIVTVTGMIKSGTTTAGTTICSLPFVPTIPQSFPLFNLNGVYVGNAVVFNSGLLNTNTAFANNTDVLLNITYAIA